MPSTPDPPPAERPLSEESPALDRGARTSRWGRILQVLALLALCAIGAELLAAYAETTGDPAGIAFSLVFFAGLYGAPALLVRDLVRRAGWGWPSMLALFAALGVVEAGLIDQSLLSADYMGYEGWEENRAPTLLPALGISGYDALSFVGGHMIFSFGAPIALAEAWTPRRARIPWLGGIGSVIAVLAYLLAAGLILGDPQSRTGSAAQLLGAGGTVVVLVLIGAALGRRHRAQPARPDPSDRPASAQPPHRGTGPRATRSPRGGSVPIWCVIGGAFVLALIPDFVPPTWPGVAIWAGVLVAGLAGLGIAGTRAGWTLRHSAAVGFGVLLERGLMAFTYDPLLGEVSAAAKYGHNVVMLLVVLAAGVLALRRSGRTSPPAPPHRPATS
jgi:hypothetical protein